MRLLQMSLAGGVMIVVITVLRALAINKVPKKTFLLLWAAAAGAIFVAVEAEHLFAAAAERSGVCRAHTGHCGAFGCSDGTGGRRADCGQDIRSGVDACLGGGTGALRGIFRGGLLAVRAGIPDVAAG